MGPSMRETFSTSTRKTNRTISQIKTEFEEVQEEWNKAEECLAVKKQLIYCQESYPTKKITKLVVLGTGSPQYPEEETRRRFLLQFATVLTLAKELGLLDCTAKSIATKSLMASVAKCPDDLPETAEDLMFSGLGIKFLSSLGITCVEDEEAFSSIDKGTFVYAVGADSCIHIILAQGYWPAALICEGVQRAFFNSWKEGRPYTNAEKHDARDMVEDCLEQPFAGVSVSMEERPNISFYWRSASAPRTRGSQRNSAERFMKFLLRLDTNSEVLALTSDIEKIRRRSSASEVSSPSTSRQLSRRTSSLSQLLMLDESPRFRLERRETAGGSEYQWKRVKRTLEIDPRDVDDPRGKNLALSNDGKPETLAAQHISGKSCGRGERHAVSGRMELDS